MTVQDVEKTKNDIVAKYKTMTPTSKKHFEEAKKWLPGGGTRNIAHIYPYPYFLTKGK